MATAIAFVSAPLLALAPASWLGSAAQGPAQPRLGLSEIAPASVLHGNHATIQLHATDPGGTALQSLAIRALLPPGIDYRAGSTTPAAAGEPQVVRNAPAPGRTALVWTNLADLGTGSVVPLSFQVDQQMAPSPNAIAPGTSFTVGATAYASTDPGTAPQFDAATGAAKSGVITADATASTAISALTVTVTSPVADGRLLRGVHDHQGVFTVGVANNGVAPTQAVTLDGYLSAALEFLGCGDVDNGRVEYQYASALRGHAAPPPGCLPSLGETAALTTDANGRSLPASAAWTHVQWRFGALAPGDTRSVSFLAAVPLRANVPFGATAATPQSLGRLANLDDNTGPQTDQAGAQTVLFEATGVDPTGTAVAASASTTVTPVDVTVAKSVDQAAFAAGQQVAETIVVQTSEYVDARQVNVTDLLPSGIGPGLTAPSPGYATPPLENPDGTSLLSFSIPRIGPSSSVALTMPLRDLAAYRAGMVDTGATLAGDAFADVVTLTSIGSTLRCATPGGVCLRGAVQGIDGSTPAATVSLAAGDASVLQRAPQPAVRTFVAERPATGQTLDCATAAYVAATPAGFVKGDLACLRLQLVVPGVLARSLSLGVTVPDGLTPIGTVAPLTGGAFLRAAQTVTSAPSSTTYTWALGAAAGGDTSPSPVLHSAAGGTFDVTIPVRVARDPITRNADDVLSASVRVTSVASSGAVDTQVSLLDLHITQPRLRIVAEAANIATPDGRIAGSWPPGAGHQGVAAHPGDLLAYSVIVTNSGLANASDTALTVQLPEGTDCATVKSTGGICSAGTIVWDTTHANAVRVPAASAQVLAFDFVVPSTLVAKGVLTSDAAIISYTAMTDTGRSNSHTSTATSDPPIMLASG